MRMKPKQIFIFGFLVLIIILFASGCSNATEEEVEQAQQMADEFLGEDQSGDSAEPEAEGETTAEEVTVVEPKVFSVAETYSNDLYATMDGLLDLIFHEPLPELREEIVFVEEQAGDNIFGDSSVTPLGEDPSADLILSGHFTLEVPTDADYPIMDFVIPCGMGGAAEEDLSVWVSCAGEGEIGDISTWYVILGSMQEIIPRYDDTRYRTIAVVVDSDNAPENNFVPTVDNDFFQGTDTWYTWGSNPELGWTPMVWGEDYEVVNSNARMLFYGNSFALFLPENEIPAPEGGFRIAADSHLGMWNPDNFFGNTSGGGPKAGLTQIDPGKKLTLYINKRGSDKWLEGSYQPCLTRGCNKMPEYKGDGNFSPELWCECTGCTEDPDCGCYVFAHYSMFGPEFMKPGEKMTWSMRGFPGEKVKVERGTIYDCFCVKEIK